VIAELSLDHRIWKRLAGGPALEAARKLRGGVMGKLLGPFVGCRLCWQITLAVFALILAVEAAILFPSARRFAANERQRIADHAQILVEPLLARAQAISERSLSLEPALGQYGVVGVSLFAPSALSRTYPAEEFFSPSLAAEGRVRQALTRHLEGALERGELFTLLQARFRPADIGTG
jgi:hypothetical protein